MGGPACGGRGEAARLQSVKNSADNEQIKQLGGKKKQLRHTQDHSQEATTYDSVCRIHPYDRDSALAKRVPGGSSPLKLIRDQISNPTHCITLTVTKAPAICLKHPCSRIEQEHPNSALRHEP